jgi:hypothetical protein
MKIRKAKADEQHVDYCDLIPWTEISEVVLQVPTGQFPADNLTMKRWLGKGRKLAKCSTITGLCAT